MKNTFFALLLIAAALTAVPAHAQCVIGQGIYPYQCDTFMVVYPGQNLNVATGFLTDDSSAALNIEHYLFKPVGVPEDVIIYFQSNEAAWPFGTFMDEDDVGMYHMMWDGEGYGTLRNNYLSGFVILRNTLPVGTEYYFQCLTSGFLACGDSLVFRNDNDVRYIVSRDWTRGDVDGDGDVDTVDVQVMQYGQFNESVYRNYEFTYADTNLYKGLTLFPWPTLLDATLTSLWLREPNHPWVVNLGIGQMMSARPAGAVVSVPGTVEVQGDWLTVYTEGQAVAATARREDGTHWREAGYVSGGSVTFYLPDDVDVSSVVVEAVQISSALGVEPPSEASLPSKVELGQNYPNPFNPSTQIAFDLKQTGHVRLQVFDLNGQLVATLVNGTVAAGQHAVTFDGANLPSGTYLYQLRAPGFVQAKKMILLK